MALAKDSIESSPVCSRSWSGINANKCSESVLPFMLSFASSLSLLIKGRRTFLKLPISPLWQKLRFFDLNGWQLNSLTPKPCVAARTCATMQPLVVTRDKSCSLPLFHAGVIDRKIAASLSLFAHQAIPKPSPFKGSECSFASPALVYPWKGSLNWYRILRNALSLSVRKLGNIALNKFTFMNIKFGTYSAIKTSKHLVRFFELQKWLSRWLPM